MNDLVDNEHIAIHGDWRLIWKVNVPPQARKLMWRICRDYIPTRTTLNSRGVQCSIICSLHEVKVETTFTCFLCEQKMKIDVQSSTLSHCLEEVLLQTKSYK